MIRKFAIRHLMEERTDRDMSVRASKARLSLDVDDSKMVRKIRTSGTDRKVRRQKSFLKIQRHLRTKFTWDAHSMTQKWIPKQSNPELQSCVVEKRLTTTEVIDEKNLTEEQFLSKDHCLELRHERPCPKMRRWISRSEAQTTGFCELAKEDMSSFSPVCGT